MGQAGVLLGVRGGRAARAHQGHLGLRGGYFRRWFGNFLVTDDQSHVASDYDRYSITPGLIPPAPASAGGATLPANIYTTGFFNQKLGTSPAPTTIIGLSDTFFPGSNMIDHWNGFDVSLDMQAAARASSSRAAPSTGKQVTDICDIVDPANAGKFGDRSPLVEIAGDGGRQPLSYLPCGAELADAGEIPGLVHRAED